MGAYDWNNLVTRITDFYEPGVFDVRSPQPRPTALARVVRTLASGEPLDELVLAQQGWWKRSDRFLYWSSLTSTSSLSLTREMSPSGRPVIIIGETGGLGNAFAQHCKARHLPYHRITHDEMEHLDAHALYAKFLHLQPWAVIMTTECGYHEDVSTGSTYWSRSHVTPHAVIADICAQQGVTLLTFSSALVFNARQPNPYVESSPVAPCCSLGKRQVLMEEQVLQRCPSALVIRTGALFHSWESTALITTLLSHIDTIGDGPIIAFTYVPDLVPTCIDLLIDGERGRWHLANSSTRMEKDGIGTRVSREILETDDAGKETTQIVRDVVAHHFWRAFVSERGQLLPSLKDALMRAHQERMRAENVSLLV